MWQKKLELTHSNTHTHTQTQTHTFQNTQAHTHTMQKTDTDVFYSLQDAGFGEISLIFTTDGSDIRNKMAAL